MNKKYTEPNRKRNERLSLRLTADEKTKFYDLAKKYKMTGTDLLLTMIDRLEEEDGLYNK